MPRCFAAVYDGHNGVLAADHAADRLHTLLAQEPALRTCTGGGPGGGAAGWRERGGTGTHLPCWGLGATGALAWRAASCSGAASICISCVACSSTSALATGGQASALPRGATAASATAGEGPPSTLSHEADRMGAALRHAFEATDRHGAALWALLSWACFLSMRGGGASCRAFGGACRLAPAMRARCAAAPGQRHSAAAIQERKGSNAAELHAMRS